MPKWEYSSLKRSLNLPIAVEWLYEDSKDDFYPDAYRFRDIVELKDDYLEQRQHRIFQIDTIPNNMEYAPKGSGMIREAIWLHPTHRILYLAILNHLLPKLDKSVMKSVYSYRLDCPDDPDAYPFPNTIDRWKQFHNDFRSAALEESTKAVLLTDLASFYDHINIETMSNRIISILGPSADSDTMNIVYLLKDLLNLWSTTGYGIPQNLDPSSFFGSLYLQNADEDIINKRYIYFRWVDDIRICAKSHDQAVRALHDLQRVLARDRLFLASDKTKIIDKESLEFEILLDVEDEVILSQAEENIAKGDSSKLKDTMDILLTRLKHHSGQNGDDRKFRACANRLVSIGDFENFADLVHTEIRNFVLPRLRSHPSRSDYWAKMLLPACDDIVIRELEDLLITRPSLYDWQRFHAWRMLTQTAAISPDLLANAKTTVRIGVSLLERSQATICVGKHGKNSDRENLFAELFTTQSPYPLQRALIIAIQELPGELRDKLFEQALKINSDHKQLVEFLKSQNAPDYGEHLRLVRRISETPQEAKPIIRGGVGLIGGMPTTFPLSSSKYDYDYE